MYGRFFRAAEGVGPYEAEGQRGAGSPEGGVWIGRILRGRFVKRPYIRFSKPRICRQASAFQVRHARVVEDASPYGGGQVRRGNANACHRMRTHTKYNHNPTTTQPQPRPDPDAEPSSHSHTPPSSQPDRKRGGVVESVENRKLFALITSGAKILRLRFASLRMTGSCRNGIVRFPFSVVYSPREG